MTAIAIWIGIVILSIVLGMVVASIVDQARRFDRAAHKKNENDVFERWLRSEGYLPETGKERDARRAEESREQQREKNAPAMYL